MNVPVATVLKDMFGKPLVEEIEGVPTPLRLGYFAATALGRSADRDTDMVEAMRRFNLGIKIVEVMDKGGTMEIPDKDVELIHRLVKENFNTMVFGRVNEMIGEEARKKAASAPKVEHVAVQRN